MTNTISNTPVHLATYVSASGSWWDKIVHHAVCFFTDSRYSHIELVVAGTCYTSSPRDGGVRSKEINLTNGRWEVYRLPAIYDNAGAVLEHYRKTKQYKYDWAGVFRFVFPWLPSIASKVYCSKWGAQALGLPLSEPSPQDLMSFLYGNYAHSYRVDPSTIR